MGYGDSFEGMAGNYATRLVDNFESDDLIVDTCEVTDGRQPYETGVAHGAYNDGDWVIVEGYDTREEAQAGHDRWVALLTAEVLPESIKDCGNAATSIEGETFLRNR